MNTHQKTKAEAIAYLDDERMLTTRETQTLLGLSRTYIHNLVRDGKLRPMRLRRGIRFRRGDVLHFRNSLFSEAKQSVHNSQASEALEIAGADNGKAL
jgi:excisionase family DNA binding protein